MNRRNFLGKISGALVLPWLPAVAKGRREVEQPTQKIREGHVNLNTIANGPFVSVVAVRSDGFLFFAFRVKVGDEQKLFYASPVMQENWEAAKAWMRKCGYTQWIITDAVTKQMKEHGIIL